VIPDRGTLHNNQSIGTPVHFHLMRKYCIFYKQHICNCYFVHFGDFKFRSGFCMKFIPRSVLKTVRDSSFISH
jgi:hypothetical protein